MTRAQISGFRIEDSFTSGWAKGFFTHKVHYFTRDSEFALIVASCGAVDTSEIVFGPGSVLCCKKCLRKHPEPEDRTECFTEEEIRAIARNAQKVAA